LEVKQAKDAFRNGGKEYPAGSYVVPMAQSMQRLARTLLDTQTQMASEFVKEQERRRKKGLSSEIYDVTAWSLPLLYNVECVAAGEVSAGGFNPVRAHINRKAGFGAR
jgi:hypothetical protein